MSTNPFAIVPVASAPASTSDSWRPPQWAQGPPQNVALTVPNTPSGSDVHSTVLDTSGNSLSATSNTVTPDSAKSTTYFFDAVIALDHYTDSVFTEHPVQSGASIVDHIYERPARVVLEVAFSDAMQSYQAGQYASSVAAFQKFLDIKSGRQPLTLTTRLKTYTNMQIESVRAPDTNQTAYGVAMRVTFRQIMLGTVATATVPAVSARPNQSQSTAGGNVQPSSVDPAVILQHSLSPSGQGIPQALQADTGNPQWSSEPVTPSTTPGFFEP